MNKIKVIIHLETEEDIIGIKEDAAAYFEKYADVKRIEVENESTNTDKQRRKAGVQQLHQPQFQPLCRAYFSMLGNGNER